MSTPRPARDPDGFFQQEEALRPDATAMFARSMLGSGVLGSLLDRIDQLLEAREERLFATADPNPSTGQPSTETVTARSLDPPKRASDAL